MATKETNPPNWQTSLITIASFLLLGGYGWYRQDANDVSMQLHSKADQVAARKIQDLQERVTQLESERLEDYKALASLRTAFYNFVRANPRGKAKPPLETPQNKE